MAKVCISSNYKQAGSDYHPGRHRVSGIPKGEQEMGLGCKASTWCIL